MSVTDAHPVASHRPVMKIALPTVAVPALASLDRLDRLDRTAATAGDRATTAGDRPAVLRIVPWEDEVADPLGVHPCSRYVEVYWLSILGPSTTFLLRRIAYGFELCGGRFDLDLRETARALGLGDRMGKNSPFRRALQRLVIFELARPHGPDALAVRARVPPLPLRHAHRLPASLRASHQQWQAERRLPPTEQMRRRATRLAVRLAAEGHDRPAIERRLWRQQFHPAIAFRAATDAVAGTTAPA